MNQIGIINLEWIGDMNIAYQCIFSAMKIRKSNLKSDNLKIAESLRYHLRKIHQLRNELQVARFVLLVICGGKFTLIWTILEKWKKMGIGCSQLVNYSFLRKK